MKTSRVAKLERLLRSRPCAGCGQSFRSSGVQEIDWDRLGAAERDELAELLAAASLPACSCCGRMGHDLSRMTDEQLDRMLQLLRILFEQTRSAV